MTLDEPMKQNAEWLEQALKRRFFEKVDAKAIDFPREQRERLISEFKTHIDDLSRRQAETVAAYDRAIARERDELDRVQSERPSEAKVKTAIARGKSRRKKGKQRLI